MLVKAQTIKKGSCKFNIWILSRNLKLSLNLNLKSKGNDRGHSLKFDRYSYVFLSSNQKFQLHLTNLNKNLEKIVLI